MIMRLARTAGRSVMGDVIVTLVKRRGTVPAIVGTSSVMMANVPTDMIIKCIVMEHWIATMVGKYDTCIFTSDVLLRGYDYSLFPSKF